MDSTSSHPSDIKWLCDDCHEDVWAEYYMVTNNIWYWAVGDRSDPATARSLCIGCLEKRWGLRLCRADFTDCPLNAEQAAGNRRLRVDGTTMPTSERLASRLADTARGELTPCSH